MAYTTMKKPNASGYYGGYAGLGGESKADSPFTRLVAQQPKTAGYMYSGSPGSMAARAPYYAGAVGPGTSPAPATPAAPAAPSTNALFDPSTDPILQSIKALGTKNIGDAVAGGDALRKQLLTQFGDPALARSTMFGDLNSGTIGDENTALAAQGNPFSTVAGLQHTHQTNDQGIDNSANQANLYYSSTHANQLGDENTNYLKGISDAQGSLQSQLGAVNGQLLSAHQSADMANIDALGTSTQNLINAAIASGYTFGGYDAAGNPILTKSGNPVAAGAAAPGGSAPGGTPVESGVASGGVTNSAPMGALSPGLQAVGNQALSGAGSVARSLQSAATQPDLLLRALSQQNQKRMLQVPLG